MTIGNLGPIEGFNRIDTKKTEPANSESSPAAVLGRDSATSRKAEASAQTDFKKTLKSVERKPNEKKPEAKPSDDRNDVVATELTAKAQPPAVKTELKQTPEPISEKTSQDIASKVTAKFDAVPTAVSTQSTPPAQSATSPMAAALIAAPVGQPLATPPAAIASGDVQTTEALADLLADLSSTADEELMLRQHSMRDFLEKMNQEFGVKPDAVIKAFAKLSPQQLQQSPESTAELILGGLNLKPEQRPRAERLYIEMLQQTGESALNEVLVGVAVGADLKVMSEQDLAMDKLQKAITSLNDSFAIRQPDSRPATDQREALALATAAPLAVASEASAFAAPVQAAAAAKPLAPAAALRPSTDKVSMTDESVNSLLASPDTETDAVAVKPEARGTFASLSAALAGLSSQVKPNTDENSEQPAARTEAEALAPLPMGTETVKSTDSASVPKLAATATAASMLTERSDSATNTQDILRQAQLLVKQGGGEMRMQLKPEGIGDVHLRVAVKDGQVAVQMLTETDSAKKALEGGLDELKASLAQHKLHVDALKIEVGSELAKQRFEQSQGDAQRDHAKQMAQDFMGQFRQDRESFRQGFQDGFGFKNYQQPRRQAQPEMEPAVAPAQARSKQSADGGSRRLNLVA